MSYTACHQSYCCIDIVHHCYKKFLSNQLDHKNTLNTQGIGNIQLMNKQIASFSEQIIICAIEVNLTLARSTLSTTEVWKAWTTTCLVTYWRNRTSCRAVAWYTVRIPIISCKFDKKIFSRMCQKTCLFKYTEELVIQTWNQILNLR